MYGGSMLGRTKIGYIYSFVKTRKDRMVDKGPM